MLHVRPPSQIIDTPASPDRKVKDRTRTHSTSLSENRQRPFALPKCDGLLYLLGRWPIRSGRLASPAIEDLAMSANRRTAFSTNATCVVRSSLPKQCKRPPCSHPNSPSRNDDSEPSRITGSCSSRRGRLGGLGDPAAKGYLSSKNSNFLPATRQLTSACDLLQEYEG